MEQIEFRGMGNDNKWHFGGITADKKFIVDHFIFIPVDPNTVGQFTGELDVEGHKIFEGDIVEIRGIPYSVDFDNGEFYFANKDDVEDFFDKCTRVIGNETENCDLL